LDAIVVADGDDLVWKMAVEELVDELVMVVGVVDDVVECKIVVKE